MRDVSIKYINIKTCNNLTLAANYVQAASKKKKNSTRVIHLIVTEVIDRCTPDATPADSTIHKHSRKTNFNSLMKQRPATKWIVKNYGYRSSRRNE